MYGRMDKAARKAFVRMARDKDDDITIADSPVPIDSVCTIG